MNLARLEEQFWRTVRAAVPASELEAHFVGSDQLCATQRMNIYRRAYWLRQERALAETFPRLRAQLGDERFGRLVASYLRQHPSDRPAIEWVGRRLPDALGSRSDLPSYLADLARLEWARIEVLLAPDAHAVVSLDSLREVDFATARAELGPHVRVLQLRRRALFAWREDPAPREASEGDQQVGCVVWRQGHRAHHRSISEVEHSALELLRGGHDFAAVCSSFSGPQAAEAAATTLGRWIRDGLLSGLRSHTFDR